MVSILKKSPKIAKIRIYIFVSEIKPKKRLMAFSCEKTITICFDIFFFMFLNILDAQWFVNGYNGVDVAD
jgi:hypothetical protein